MTTATIVRVAAPRNRVSFVSFMESDAIEDEDIGLANIAEAVHVTPRAVQCLGSFSLMVRRPPLVELATYCETGAAGVRPDVRRPCG
jgi:hypothetical protein